MDFSGGVKHWDKCKLRTALEWVVFTSTTGVSRVRLIRVKLVLVNLSTINDTYSFQNVADERIKPIFPKGSKFEGLSARNSSIQAC